MKPHKKKESFFDSKRNNIIVLSLGLLVLIALSIYFFSRTLIIVPYRITGDSMAPTLVPGDIIFSNPWVYRFGAPKRGDIIVFRYPLVPKVKSIKRIVGLPGEKVEIKNGNLFINGQITNTPQIPLGRFYRNREDGDYGKTGQIIEVPADSYYVLGDHSIGSSDSRIWGFVSRKSIIGKGVYRWWPLRRFKKI